MRHSNRQGRPIREHAPIATWLGALLLALSIPTLAPADDDASKPVEAKDTSETAPPETAPPSPPAERRDPRAAAPAYSAPPDRGAPERRVGGATRRPVEPVEVVALAPDHLGRTRVPSPTLYWRTTRDAGSRVDFSLAARLSDGRLAPVLETTIAPQAEAGIGSLSLAEHGVELEPGVVYRWYVAVVSDPDRRSRDVVAGAAVQRIARMPAHLVPGVEAAGIYASEGFWYDALGAVQTALADPPGSPDAPDDLRAARRSLLAQVGIPSDR